jgi:hypothetical protein
MKAHSNSEKYITLMVIEINGHYAEFFSITASRFLYFQKISAERQIPNGLKTEEFEKETTPLKCYKRVELILHDLGYNIGITWLSLIFLCQN